MDDALMVRRVGELILAGKRAVASGLLDSIPKEDRVAPSTPQTVTQEVLLERDSRRPSIAQMFAVHERYGWRCQYCGRRVVIAGVIELVGRLCPEVVPWWRNHNMARADTHPAAERLYPNVDHIKARAVGGRTTDDDNLICSCTTCNERKGSRGGWQPIVTSEPWDGCVPLFAPLYDQAREKGATLTPTIVAWLNAARQR
jgi:hypothetical protein